jgi:hypothetical protein
MWENAMGFELSSAVLNLTYNGTFDEMVMPAEPNATSLWEGLDLEKPQVGTVAMSSCSGRLPWMFLPLLVILALCKFD